MMAVQHHEAKYWTQKCADSFDRLYEEARSGPDFGHRHSPYISGSLPESNISKPFTITSQNSAAYFTGMVTDPGLVSES